ncbi:MAG: thiamine-phosphate kinase [Planctomycetaceae bacterium]|nr:thiamine-phosphate kinase [Planctomycetaceae bacterium]
MPHPDVVLGIGDDAALLAASENETVLTVDLLTEGVDFLLEQVDPVLIGRKALAVNLSDLAAMAAVPTAILIAVTLSKTDRKTAVGALSPLELGERLFDGIRTLAGQYDVAIIGGDTNTWDGGLVLSITAIGRTTEHGVTRRNGAKPGDRIFVTGPLGGSILQHQFTFEPRIREALFLNSHYDIHAAMDISDGLSLDLSRLVCESGCGAILWEVTIPVADDARRMNDALTPLEHALYDGEDFELLFTVPPQTAETLLREQPLDNPLYEIGEITAAKNVPIRILTQDGVLREQKPKGFVH